MTRCEPTRSCNRVAHRCDLCAEHRVELQLILKLFVASAEPRVLEPREAGKLDPEGSQIDWTCSSELPRPIIIEMIRLCSTLSLPPL